MGHWRLGELAHTRKWREVIDLLATGADTATIAARTIDASIAQFRGIGSDPGLAFSFWILTQLPTAARSNDVLGALGGVGVPVRELTSASLLKAINDAVDRHRDALGKRTDAGELARAAVVEALGSTISDRVGSLFAATPEDVAATLAGLGSVRNFGLLTRTFLGRFLEKHLEHYLSREISRHVGAGKAISGIEGHFAFRAALATHCHETARIAEAFAGEWLSKTAYVKGGVSYEDARGFLHQAFTKIAAELKARAAT